MRTGRPIAPVSRRLMSVRRWDVGRDDRERAGAGPTRADSLECASGRPTRRLRQAGSDLPDGGQMAPTFLERRLAACSMSRGQAPRAKWATRRLSEWCADFGERARGRHALEHARDGEALRLEPEHGEPHLAGVCAAAASRRRVSAFQRPAVHREGARYRGALPHPPARALVLCVDEKTQIQALDRSQPLLPMRPGQAERRTPDDLRHGTTNLFAALDFKAGTVIGQLHRRHRAVEFRQFLETIDHEVPRRCALHDHR